MKVTIREMKVTILGNNSALPAFGRHPTCQIVTVYGNHIMLDCGEGTQVQMQRNGIKWKNLSHIFISHMHGDHYFGLPGLINSMSLMGRTAPLHVYGPPALNAILNQIFVVADTVLCFPYTFHELEPGSHLLADTPSFTVTSFDTEHRIPCHGFLIERKTRGRKLLPDKCEEYEVPASFYTELKNGLDYIKKDGTVVKNNLLTTDGPSPKKYAYCADSRFTESFLPVIKDADTIYHECTYMHEDEEKAIARFHSTSVQAAQLAKMANARQLLLGHFSSKYRDTHPFREEAARIFPNVLATQEGMSYEI